MSHFIPDLMGNLHSFSKQKFRCVTCNAKYRRAPLIGKCTRDGGKLLLTISKGSIEKYLATSLNLAERYNIDVYTKQRLLLLRDEIFGVFGNSTAEQRIDANQKKIEFTQEQATANGAVAQGEQVKEAGSGQFDLSRFI